MILSARLYIKGHKNEKEGIHLLSCSFRFYQECDGMGLPASRVNGGRVDMSLASIEDNEIIQWMISEDADKSGKIEFSGDNNTKPFKTLEFKDARLVEYQESFVDQGQMITTLSLSVRQIDISGVKHTNKWLGYK